MPRLEINHENTIMYKIVCNDLNITDLYVGQTTNFTVRKSSHKSNSCNERCKIYNTKVYKFIRENGGWNNFSMVEIEKFTCNDSNEAHKRERYWVETLNASLNGQVPSRSRSEFHRDYRVNNREYLIDLNNEWLKSNIERLKTKTTCFCGGSYAFRDKGRHLKSKTHLDNINPIPLPIVLKEKVNCPCGGCYIYGGKNRHLKSRQHLDYLENPELPLTIVNRVDCLCGGRYGSSKAKKLHFKSLKHLAYLANTQSQSLAI